MVTTLHEESKRGVDDAPLTPLSTALQEAIYNKTTLLKKGNAEIIRRCRDGDQKSIGKLLQSKEIDVNEVLDENELEIDL